MRLAAAVVVGRAGSRLDRQVSNIIVTEVVMLWRASSPFHSVVTSV